MTTEDDFQRVLDAQPDDWQTRLVFADWLQERGDPRATGYRAIAVQERCPFKRRHLDRDACWWCSSTAAAHDDARNAIPHDWFALLPRGEGSNLFWPLHTPTGGIRSRRECEDALALAFSRLPTDRQGALLDPEHRADASGDGSEAP